MKMASSKIQLPLILFMGVMISCSLFGPGDSGSTPTPSSDPTPVESTSETDPPPTNDAPTATEAATDLPGPTDSPTLAPTTTDTPECLVLQNLNYRVGPGIAYRPPIRALEQGTTLTPIGFNPVGVPGGSWVQVQDPAANDVGWVSAGAQFVNCSIDLNGLPPVDVPLPPPPPPPSFASSAPDGTIHPDWVTELIYDPDFLVRLLAYDTQDYGSGPGAQDGDGIVTVTFQVIDPNGEEIWTRVEEFPAYCIFSGGEPDCNPWVIEDYFFRWGTGGPVVMDGEHHLSIVAVAEDGDTSNWNIDLDIDLPY